MITETPQSTAFELVINQLNAATGCNIVIGPLPEKGGITAEINNGIDKGRYLNNQHGKEQLTVLFLCKDKTQHTAFNTLTAIGNILKRMEPMGTATVNISGAEVRSGAGLVGNDGGYYIFSMIVGININF